MKGLLSIPHLLLAAVLQPRETPQELSHRKYINTVKRMLDLNNTLSIPDPIVGLLTDEAAASILGSSPLPNCLQANIADVSFTNAKAVNNLDGMVASLVYRALERNTASVGQASERCTKYIMINPEFTFHQHQDPASPSARSNNKAVVLELARQIALMGGDPVVALDSGTFSPSDVQDARGNSCNTDDCIFQQGLLVNDASNQEIFDYVGNCVSTITIMLPTTTGAPQSTTVLSGSRPPETVSATSSSTSAQAVPTTAPPTTTSTTSVQASPPPPPVTTAPTNPNGGNQNLQTFTGALLGIPAPAVTASGNNFVVAGTDALFTSLVQALTRSCDNQKNACANAANSQGTATVPQCDAQQQQCKNAGPR